MAVEVHGFSGNRARQAAKWAAKSLADFEDDSYVLRVGHSISPYGPGHADAQGIYLTDEAFTNGNTDRQRDAYLGFIVYEEVAHHFLERAGVPSASTGPLETFVHETFATWYQMDAFAGRVIPYEFLSWPQLPRRNAMYELGNYLGAALANVRGAREELDSWLGSASSDASEKQVVMRFRNGLPPPPLIVEHVVDLYNRLR